MRRIINWLLGPYGRPQGLLVVYINVGTLAQDKVEAFVGTFKNSLGTKFADNAKRVSYDVLYVPTRTGDTRIESIKF